MKVLGTFIATFALSLTFAFAQATQASSTADKKACTGEAKAACCAGKSEKASCCKDGAKGNAEAINTKDAKAVTLVEEETVTSSPGGNTRRVTRKSDKRASMRPAATKE